MRDPTRFFKNCFQIRCTNCFKKCPQISCANCFHVHRSRHDVQLQTFEIPSHVPLQMSLQTTQIAPDVPLQAQQISLQTPQVASDVPLQAQQIIPSKEKGSPSSPPLFRENISRTELERALTHFKKRLSALDTKSISDEGDDVDLLAERGSSLLEAMKTKTSPGANSEALVKVLATLLGGVGRIHWVAAGLSLIAVALKTYQKYSGNQKECLQMLERMIEVMELLKELWEPQQEHEEKLQRITGVLILGAANCCSIACKSWPYRVFFASTTKDDLAELRKTLDSERQQLQLIISTIMKKQAAKPYYRPEPKSLEFAIGLDRKADEVMRLLQFRGHDKPVRTVCLQGMGGIGKSSLGDAVYTKLQIQKNHCKVELPLGKTDDPTKRQQEIMEKLFEARCNRIGNEGDGRDLMEKTFRGLNVPVFIFLDNVQSKEQVRELLPEGDCFPVGSAIIVTTRDKDVYKALDEKNFCPELVEMKGLPDDEARELLYTSIGKEKVEEPSFNEVRDGGCVERLLRACDGLPLALKVVGGYIGGADRLNSKQFWEVVIKKLGEGKPLQRGEDVIHSRLLFSIEGLDEEEKSAFLDIVAFYVDSYEEWGDVEYYVGRELLELLEKRALVERSTRANFQGRQVCVVRVHDVVKGLGHRLIEKGEEQLRITSGRDLDDVLEESNNDPSILSKIRGIWPHEGRGENRLAATKLEQMRSLLILFIGKSEIDGICKRTPKNMHLIRVHGSWPFEGRVSASAIDLLGCECDLQSLSDVKLLTIFDSSSLTSIAQIPSCVERLILERCSSLLEGTQCSSSLTYLSIAHCKRFRAVPVDASSLEELHLLDCPSLHSLPPSFSGLTRLRQLIIQRCENFRMFPSGINTMSSLELVLLHSCERLEELPDAWGQVKLELERCPSLRMVPREFLIRASSKSKSFSFEGFRVIQELPHSFDGLSFLEKLDLSRCKKLCSIPQAFGTTLSSLQDLTLEECENLETLPEEFGFLESLGFLNLSHCTKLKRLPHSFSKLGSLKVLYMRKCILLETLPQDLGELHSLCVLDLRDTPIKQLSTGLTQLSKLQIVLLSGCGSMGCVPEGLLQMKSLRYVDIRGCSLQLEESEHKQSRGPLVVSSRLPDQLEHKSTKSGSVKELLLQRVLYDARGEPALVNNMVGLVFQELDRGNRCPAHFCDRIADEKLWRAGKQPQFIYVPHVSCSPDWRWDDYKRTFEFGLEDVPDDLPEVWLRAIDPLHGTALYAALQEGGYHPIRLGSCASLALISLDKGAAHSWFDLLGLLPDVGDDGDSSDLFTDVADEQDRIAQLEQYRMSRNLLATDKTDYVVSNNGKQMVKVAALKGKIVGVYFCSFPPEEAFTRILKDIYHNLKGKEQEAFEVVWIPFHDCRGDEICECCGDMPWPSLPACNGRSLQTLFSWYRDKSPALVVFDGEGKILQENAVESCFRFGNRAYPFTDERIAGLQEEEHRIMLQSQPTLWTLLDGSRFLIARDGSEVDVNSLKGKTVGLLYLPYSLNNEKCDSLFVQKLIAKYEEIRGSREQPLEIVAIFYGDSEEGFQSSVQAMPWLALPFCDALRLTWQARGLLEVWKGPAADIDQNLLRWRWLLCYPLLCKSECLIMFNGDGSVMRGCGEDILTSDACQFMMPSQFRPIHGQLRQFMDHIMMPSQFMDRLCISKVYGLPSTIHHPSHPQHSLSIKARLGATCDLCNTPCDLRVSYCCVDCDFDLCLDPCSQCPT